MVQNGIFKHQADKSLTRNTWRPSVQHNWKAETGVPLSPASSRLKGVEAFQSQQR